MSDPAINAGDLRQRITFNQPSIVQDPTDGTPSQTLTTFATRWAKIKPLSGTELVQAQQIHAETTHKITCRYIEGIDTTFSIAYGSRNFNVLSVLNEDERDIQSTILAKERT